MAEEISSKDISSRTSGIWLILLLVAAGIGGYYFYVNMSNGHNDEIARHTVESYFSELSGVPAKVRNMEIRDGSLSGVVLLRNFDGQLEERAFTGKISEREGALNIIMLTPSPDSIEKAKARAK